MKQEEHTVISFAVAPSAARIVPFIYFSHRNQISEGKNNICVHVFVDENMETFRMRRVPKIRGDRIPDKCAG